MYIKVNEEGKITAACSIKADDSFIETTVNNFDLSNFDYFVKDNTIVAVEKEKEDLEKLARIHYLQERLSQLSQDFVQVWCGAELADVDARILEFQLLHNELRTLNGKEPRAYTHENPENTENTVDENV